MQTVNRNSDSKHPCRSPTTTVNGRGITSPTWTQTYEQKYSGTRKAEVLNSLIINTTAKANDTTDILQRNTVTWQPATCRHQHLLPQHFPNVSQGTRLYAFSRSTKHVKMSLAYQLRRFLKILLEGEMWSVVLQPWRQPHWISVELSLFGENEKFQRRLSFSFGLIISRHLFFSWHLAT